MCILSVYTLLKVASYYDLSILSMSLWLSQKMDGSGWVGWALSNFFLIFWFVLTLQSPLLPIHNSSSMALYREGYADRRGDGISVFTEDMSNAWPWLLSAMYCQKGIAKYYYIQPIVLDRDHEHNDQARIEMLFYKVGTGRRVNGIEGRWQK